MPAAATTSTTPLKRRIPRQDRSRRRVEELLDAAARLVLERGVDALTTRDIAEGAGAPVASLYQYFSDKEDVLLALGLRDMAEMDNRVASDLAELEVVSPVSLRDLMVTKARAVLALYGGEGRRPFSTTAGLTSEP